MSLETLLLLGFGGPEGPAEVESFLDSVLAGVPIPPERRREVAAHYEHFGGRSPYNAKVEKLRRDIEREFAARGRAVRVLSALRHSRPSYAEAVSALRGTAEPPAAFVLSALRSVPSYGKYLDAYAAAARAAGVDPLVRELPAFDRRADFIRMQADQLLAVPGGISSSDAVIFAAHSIPTRLSQESGYAEQFNRLSDAIALSAGLARHWTAYQSRSGRPQDPWLEPDVLQTVRELPAEVKRVVLMPIGFLCENVEILYDLDTEVRAAVEGSGRAYARGAAVMDHPSFAALVADLYVAQPPVSAAPPGRPAPRVAVLGAGIAGLAAAYELRSAGVDTVVYEAGPSAGGSIGTESRDGFLMELGPDSFLSEKSGMIDLCKRLGLEADLQGTCAGRRRSYVLRGKRLIEIPPGFYLIAPSRIDTFVLSPLFSPWGKLRLLAESLVPARSSEEDESVGDFIRRRFGKEALERAGQPLLAGIYTGDPDELSLLSTMPRFRKLEKEHGSVIRGLLKGRQTAARSAQGPRYDLFLTLREGMGQAVARLTAQLPAGALRLSSRVTRLSVDGSGGWFIRAAGAAAERYDAVILALPAYAAAELLSDCATELAGLLSGIPYESVATLNLAFDRQAIADPLEGFGFVVPRTERLPFVACSYSSRKFEGRAPHGKVLLRAFVGGVFGREAYAMDPEDLERRVLSALSGILGIRARPLFTVLTRYPRAMVQYRVGHAGLIRRIRAQLPSLKGLALTGSALSGAGIPDGVSDARTEALRILEYVRAR